MMEEKGEFFIVNGRLFNGKRDFFMMEEKSRCTM
jgi:hypothetical protein